MGIPHGANPTLNPLRPTPPETAVISVVLPLHPAGRHQHQFHPGQRVAPAPLPAESPHHKSSPGRGGGANASTAPGTVHGKIPSVGLFTGKPLLYNELQGGTNIQPKGT